LAEITTVKRIPSDWHRKKKKKRTRLETTPNTNPITTQKGTSKYDNLFIFLNNKKSEGDK
jgi:hypothetical protein